MRTYWDSSAVINAAISAEVFARLETGEHFTRLHTFSEFFSTLTGRGIILTDEGGNLARFNMSANECAAWLGDFGRRVQMVRLDKAEVLDALEKAQSRSIQGGRIHDYLHAVAAKKAKADLLVTRNTDDFKDLAPNVEWP